MGTTNARRLLAEAQVLERQARWRGHTPLAEQGEHELETAMQRLRDELHRPAGVGSTQEVRR